MNYLMIGKSARFYQIPHPSVANYSSFRPF